jgi:hypothetical protein
MLPFISITTDTFTSVWGTYLPNGVFVRNSIHSTRLTTHGKIYVLRQENCTGSDCDTVALFNIKRKTNYYAVPTKEEANENECEMPQLW